MSKKRILVVDDEVNIRRILQVAFDKEGWHALTAESAHEALETLRKQRVDCVLSDVTMPGMSGYQLQEAVAEDWPEMPFILMTAFGTIPQAVQAVRRGAYEYVTKPFDLDGLKQVVRGALEHKPSGPRRAKVAAKADAPATEMVFRSDAMAQIAEMIEQVADSRATVLVTGESGTGKEVVAKRLHALSPRAENPFVALSCAAIPETLLESELFGYRKGAFTGADTDKEGRFELADSGTLFLDEIGDIPMMTQIKLLRVLQERAFERLGDTETTRVDVRLVTATNRDLQRMVDDGEFRLDLMYRLRVVEIHLPALRERRDDILPLAEHFLAKHGPANERQVSRVGGDATALLEQYAWPGNVRELENAIESALAMCKRDDETLEARHLPAMIRNAA